MCYIRQCINGPHFCYLADHCEILWNWEGKFIVHVDLEELHDKVNCLELWNISDEGGNAMFSANINSCCKIIHVLRQYATYAHCIIGFSKEYGSAN